MHADTSPRTYKWFSNFKRKMPPILELRVITILLTPSIPSWINLVFHLEVHIFFHDTTIQLTSVTRNHAKISLIIMHSDQPSLNSTMNKLHVSRSRYREFQRIIQREFWFNNSNVLLRFRTVEKIRTNCCRINRV